MITGMIQFVNIVFTKGIFIESMFSTSKGIQIQPKQKRFMRGCRIIIAHILSQGTWALVIIFINCFPDMMLWMIITSGRFPLEGWVFLFIFLFNWSLLLENFRIKLILEIFQGGYPPLEIILNRSSVAAPSIYIREDF